MSATSGPTSPTRLGRYDPETCSWRTFEDMYGEGSTVSSQTWPAWGMTRAGELFALPTPALPTAESGSSSLLPTPVVNDMGAGKTPEAWDDLIAGWKAKHGNGNGHGKSLSIEALRLLPTPQAHDAHGAKTPEKVAEMRARGYGVRNLNETVRNELTGATTAPLSPDGNESSVVQPLHQLSLDE